MLGEAPEEAEGEGGVEDGVDGPQEHHVRPHPVPSAAEQSTLAVTNHGCVASFPHSLALQGISAHHSQTVF
jgi:hypothetical protein